MSYYRGDYYAGGFFSSIGGILKGVASTAASFIPGVGPMASKVISAIPTGAAKSGAVASAAGAGMSMVKAGTGAVTSAIIKHPVLSAAGAAGVAGGLIGAGAERMFASAGACPKGFHISKSKHAKHFGQCVRNRRMNVANGRALSRATRRLHAFARRYRKVVGFVSPKKPKGHMYFKKRRKAK